MRFVPLVGAGLMSAACCTAPTGSGTVDGASGWDIPAEITGRLLDEQGRPLPGRGIQVVVRTVTWDSAETRSTQAHLDCESRFKVKIAVPQSTARRRNRLEFWLPLDGEQLEPDGPPHVFVDHVEALDPRICNLGTLVMSPPGTLGSMRRIDDDALESKYRSARASAGQESRRDELFEACLIEMSRRGGARWIAFLEKEAEPATKPLLPNEPTLNDLLRGKGFDSHWNFLLRRPGSAAPVRQPFEGDRVDDPWGWVLLTSLRRAQRRPDPLAVQVEGFESGDRELDGSETLRVRCANVDPTGAFEIACGGFSPRFGVRVVGADGALVRPRERVAHGKGGGLIVTGLLGPGGACPPVEIPIREFVSGLPPGDYALTIQYHDIDRFGSGPTTSCRIVISSKPIRMRIAP